MLIGSLGIMKGDIKLLREAQAELMARMTARGPLVRGLDGTAED
jgi:hypothetical protein